ncbi:ADP-ribosyl cyclase/cyclic ADP-ribose hydrolase 1-like isoform X2 [Xiphias gladius]|uniref:ADP-ribosyl cyclase/cyclic ADP-ribose hydrolase 1-like isoform X2 n=1 Tax=Xiphias gladius TaxID=8245 RepID=UPI001A97E8DA|nr:ADP-ribosyl cyclase/cyclic ADP-ribose hydrolase 1-like isoform X2 [Xiphias gladius]
MEPGGHRPAEKRGGGRRRCVILSVAAGLLLVTVAVVLGLTLRQKADKLRPTFMARCKGFKGYDCEKIWEEFTQAYVGQDPCKVPMEAYDPLVAAAPLKSSCNRIMLWSKTKEMVHDFTKKKDCFITLEDTVLGFVLDGLTWCGKEGSSETFTTSCPGWTECENNPVRSFWKRASAAFADVACGDVTAMLNGSITTPFDPKGANCRNTSLKDLQKVLDVGITYNCTEVAESQILECSSNPEIPCGACW